MKEYYIVMVNNKIMVRVQAENSIDAVSVVANRYAEENSKYGVFTEITVFPREELKEDYFYDHFCKCELVSMWDLGEMIGDYANTIQDIEDSENILRGLNKKVAKKEKSLKELKEKLDHMSWVKSESIEQRKRQAAALGIEIKEDAER